MLRLRFAIAAVTALLGLAPAAAQTPSHTRVEGTSVELKVPDGFQPKDRYPGFEDPQSGASLLVTEIPGPVAGITAGFTEEGLKAQGMTLVTSDPATFSGTPGQLLSTTQVAAGTSWRKWIGVFGDEAKTVLVVAVFPGSAPPDLGATLRAAVLSARPADGAHGREEGLIFRVEESARLVTIHRVGNMLMLAPPGSSIPVPNSQPVLIVGSSIAPAPVPTLKAFAETRAGQFEHIRDLSQIEGRKLEIGGLPAYELTARAIDSDSGAPMVLYELILDEGGYYHIAVGLIAESAFAAALEDFREVAQSIRLR